jgi:hypothetical protein
MPVGKLSLGEPAFVIARQQTLPLLRSQSTTTNEINSA